MKQHSFLKIFPSVLNGSFDSPYKNHEDQKGSLNNDPLLSHNRRWVRLGTYLALIGHLGQIIAHPLLAVTSLFFLQTPSSIAMESASLVEENYKIRDSKVIFKGGEIKRETYEKLLEDKYAHFVFKNKASIPASIASQLKCLKNNETLEIVDDLATPSLSLEHLINKGQIEIKTSSDRLGLAVRRLDNNGTLLLNGLQGTTVWNINYDEQSASYNQGALISKETINLTSMSHQYAGILWASQISCEDIDVFHGTLVVDKPAHNNAPLNANAAPNPVKFIYNTKESEPKRTIEWAGALYAPASSLKVSIKGTGHADLSIGSFFDAGGLDIAYDQGAKGNIEFTNKLSCHNTYCLPSSQVREYLQEPLILTDLSSADLWRRGALLTSYGSQRVGKAGLTIDYGNSGGGAREKNRNVILNRPLSVKGETNITGTDDFSLNEDVVWKQGAAAKLDIHQLHILGTLKNIPTIEGEFWLQGNFRAGNASHIDLQKFYWNQKRNQNWEPNNPKTNFLMEGIAHIAEFFPSYLTGSLFQNKGKLILDIIQGYLTVHENTGSIVSDQGQINFKPTLEALHKNNYIQTGTLIAGGNLDVTYPKNLSNYLPQDQPLQVHAAFRSKTGSINIHGTGISLDIGTEGPFLWQAGEDIVIDLVDSGGMTLKEGATLEAEKRIKVGKENQGNSISSFQIDGVLSAPVVDLFASFISGRGQIWGSKATLEAQILNVDDFTHWNLSHLILRSRDQDITLRNPLNLGDGQLSIFANNIGLYDAITARKGLLLQTHPGGALEIHSPSLQIDQGAFIANTRRFNFSKQIQDIFAQRIIFYSDTRNPESLILPETLKFSVEKEISITYPSDLKVYSVLNPIGSSCDMMLRAPGTVYFAPVIAKDKAFRRVLLQATHVPHDTRISNIQNLEIVAHNWLPAGFDVLKLLADTKFTLLDYHPSSVQDHSLIEAALLKAKNSQITTGDGSITFTGDSCNLEGENQIENVIFNSDRTSLALDAMLQAKNIGVGSRAKDLSLLGKILTEQDCLTLTPSESLTISQIARVRDEAFKRLILRSENGLVSSDLKADILEAIFTGQLNLLSQSLEIQASLIKANLLKIQSTHLEGQSAAIEAEIAHIEDSILKLKGLALNVKNNLEINNTQVSADDLQVMAENIRGHQVELRGKRHILKTDGKIEIEGLDHSTSDYANYEAKFIKLTGILKSNNIQIKVDKDGVIDIPDLLLTADLFAEISGKSANFDPNKISAGELVLKLKEYTGGTPGILKLADDLKKCATVRIDARDYPLTINNRTVFRPHLHVIFDFVDINAPVTGQGVLGLTGVHDVNVLDAVTAESLHLASESGNVILKQALLKAMEDVTIQAADHILQYGGKIESGRLVELEAGKDIKISGTEQAHHHLKGLFKGWFGRHTPPITSYKPAEIIGGTGVDSQVASLVKGENGLPLRDPETGSLMFQMVPQKVGVHIHAGGKVNVLASHIQSASGAYVGGDEGVDLSPHVFYEVRTHSRTSGWLTKKTATTTEYIPHVTKTNFAALGTFHVESVNGNINARGTDFVGIDGVIMGAKGNIGLYDVVAPHTVNVSTNSSFLGCIPVGKSSSRHMTEISYPTTLLSQKNIYVRSEDGKINGRGVLMMTPDAVILQAPEGIELSTSILNEVYEYMSCGWSISNPILDAATTLARGGTVGAALGAMHPLMNTLHRLSNEPNHWGRLLTTGAIQGFNTLHNLSNSQSFMKGLGQELGLTNTDKNGKTSFAPSVRLGYTETHMKQESQHVGSGGIFAGALAMFTNRDIKLVNAFPVDIAHNAYIQAANLSMVGAALKSRFKSQTISAGVNVSANWRWGVDGSYRRMDGEGTTWQNLPFNVGGNLELKIKNLISLEAANIRAKKLKGGAKNLRIVSQANTSSYSGGSVGGSVSFTGCIPTGGSMGVSWQEGSERLVGEIAGIHVSDGLNETENEFVIEDLTDLTGAAITSDGFMRWITKNIKATSIDEHKKSESGNIDVSINSNSSVNSLSFDFTKTDYQATLKCMIYGREGTNLVGRITGEVVTDPSQQRQVHKDDSIDIGFVVPLTTPEKLQSAWGDIAQKFVSPQEGGEDLRKKEVPDLEEDSLADEEEEVKSSKKSRKEREKTKSPKTKQQLKQSAKETDDIDHEVDLNDLSWNSFFNEAMVQDIERELDQRSSRDQYNEKDSLQVKDLYVQPCFAADDFYLETVYGRSSQDAFQRKDELIRGRSRDREFDLSQRSKSYSPPRIKDTCYEIGKDYVKKSYKQLFEVQERFVSSGYDVSQLSVADACHVASAYGFKTLGGIARVTDTLTFGTVSEFGKAWEWGAKKVEAGTRRAIRYVTNDPRTAQNSGDYVYLALSFMGPKKILNLMKAGEIVVRVGQLSQTVKKSANSNRVGDLLLQTERQKVIVGQLPMRERSLPYAPTTANSNRLNPEYKGLQLFPDSRRTTVLTADKIHPSSSIIPLEKPGRVVFDGVEFRAVRDLGHMSEKDLRKMLEIGGSPYDMNYTRLDGHHHQQQYHRAPGAFIVEIPAPLHNGANKIQHPLGNKKGVGLTEIQRNDWKKTKKAFNKERARQELSNRGLINEKY